MNRGSFAVAAFSLWAASASGLDVTGNWSVSGTPVSTITVMSLTQTGTTLSLCVNGYGTAATGTVDEGTGTFTLTFDPQFANLLYEFGVCGLDWTGSFAPDGSSLTGDETYSLNCSGPPPFFCCEPSQSAPITGTRVSTTVACCGNGVIESGEACDIAPNGGIDCCSNTCTFEPAGHFCGADDQCHLKECDAGGVCQSLPPFDCGPCYECDPVSGCEPDLRSTCAVGGSGSALRAIQRTAGTKLIWRWREGSSPETTLADFGDPTADTDYDLCVFTRDLDPDGFPRVAAALAGGATCANGPCWTPARNGFQYKDSAGSADGIIRAKLLARANRKSQLKVAGRGVTLFPPLDDEVIVQLSANDADPSRCWSTSFTAPQLNITGRYLATLP